MCDEVIFSYTAEDALQDGVLMEIEKDFSQEAGFKWPVRITRGVHALLTPSEEAQEYGQDFQGRLWDVLNLARNAIRQTPGDETLACFPASFYNGPGKERKISLWAALDLTSGPAIHILLPEEY